MWQQAAYANMMTTAMMMNAAGSGAVGSGMNIAGSIGAISTSDDRNNEDDDESEEPRGAPSSHMDHPNYRPANMEHVRGVTDKRFEGTLKVWFEDKGFGF